MTYTCGCDLSPNTTYFVVAAYSGDALTDGYRWRFYDGNNFKIRYPANNGWDIGTSHYKNDGSNWSSWNDWHAFRADFWPKE